MTALTYCPRCLKLTDGEHNCTPTPEWRALEEQRDQARRLLRDIARIAHFGGLAKLSESDALVLIRKATINRAHEGATRAGTLTNVLDAVARAEGLAR